MTASPDAHTSAPSKGELRLYAFVRAALIAFAKVWFRVSVRGKEHVPKEGAYIISPVHRSNLDFLLVLVLSKRRFRYMGKDSLWNGPWGRLFTALGGFPVARGTADREALRRCVEVIENGEPLVLFPEGTRQHGPEIQEMFDGAAFVQSKTGVPIVPVGIGGSEAAMPKGSKFIRPQKVVLRVGPVLTAPQVEGSKARRSAIRERTAELHGELQDLFDRAQQDAGTPNHR